MKPGWTGAVIYACPDCEGDLEVAYDDLWCPACELAVPYTLVHADPESDPWF